MKYAVANFQSMRYGFAKFSEYLQYVCKGTEFCVARPQNSQAVLMLRDAVQTGVEILPDLDLQDLQTVEGYRSLLATGGPIFRLPQASELHNVCHGLLQHPPEKVDLGTTIEELVASVPGLSSDSAKLGMLSLLSSGAFLREPEGVPLSEQQLTLKPEFRSVDAMMTALQIACKQKLTQLLPTVHEEFIQQLLGIYTPSPPSTESV
jgi:hypothetical protein